MNRLAQRVIEATESMVDTEYADGPLVRRIGVYPEHDCWESCAFDKPTCKPGTGGWHGIGSRTVAFSVSVTGRGAVSFELSTPIYTETALRRGDPVSRWSPLGPLDIHYVDPPDYLRELDWGTDDCRYVDGKCWSDVTFLQADHMVDVLLAQGAPGVWSWLAEAWLPMALGAS